MLRIKAGPLLFTARLDTDKAPATVAAFRELLPFRSLVIQSRWSGEAAWIPLERALNLQFENATSYPAPGQILLYPGGPTDPELLWAYGVTRFASPIGQLAGSRLATIEEGFEQLAEFGRMVARRGAQEVLIEDI